VKDIILWQSAAAREREKRYFTELRALHQSAIPPSELLLPIPRKLRWKRMLKFVMWLHVTLLAFVTCMAIWCVDMETQFHNDVVQGLRQHSEIVRHEATQKIDSQKRAKIEDSIREDEELLKKWRLLHAGILFAILLGVLACPVANLCMTWFIHARPELILLREGVPVRAAVIGKKSWLLVTNLLLEFTTERGESIRKKQIVRKAEAPLFPIGALTWMLYSPSRPSRARMYGLKAALGEIVQ
jgi:hypothetical protein